MTKEYQELERKIIAEYERKIEVLEARIKELKSLNEFYARSINDHYDAFREIHRLAKAIINNC